MLVSRSTPPSPPADIDSVTPPETRKRFSEETSDRPATRQRLDTPDGLASRPAPQAPSTELLPPRFAVPAAGSASASVLARPAAEGSPGQRFDRELARKHYPKLTAYLEERERALASDKMPSLASIKDIHHIEDLVDGLNLADPTLNLDYYEVLDDDELEAVADSPLALDLHEHLQLDPASRTPWRAVVSTGSQMTGGHRVALSIHCSKTSNDVSMLLIDSSSFKTPEKAEEERAKWHAVLGILSQAVQSRLDSSAPPVRLHLSYAAAGTHKALEGCTIFALSAAKKMSSDPAILALHDRALHGLSANLIPPGAVHLSAQRHMPPSIFKHATSRTAVTGYLKVKQEQHEKALDLARRGIRVPAVDPQAPVNKKGETLIQRYLSNVIKRTDAIHGDLIEYSNSYEKKRLDLIKTALAGLTALQVARGTLTRRGWPVGSTGQRGC